ncbi:MAG: 16S rRNA (guanine(527)-N(7))-methyltransferase RsmG [Pseudomonadota bacterium]
MTPTGSFADQPPRDAKEGQMFLRRHDIDISLSTAEKLLVYANLLRRWQPAQNLVAGSSLDSVWERHFLDSLQLLSLVETCRPSGQREDVQQGRAVDLGSGAGFPGMVLAIANEGPKATHRLQMSLVEPNKRKVAFLRTVSRETGANVDIYPARAEDLPDLSVDFVFSRALAPLPELVALSGRFLERGAIGLFHKGVEIDAEIANWDAASAYSVVTHPSVLGSGAILEIRRAARPHR